MIIESLLELRVRAYRPIPANARKGEKHPLARLVEANVVEMRRLRTAGASVKELAERFGVSTNHVTDIINRKRWSHVR